MKKFIYDSILEKENICNLKREQNILHKNVKKGKNTVIYGRRNTGKTSLVRNIITPRFRSQNKKSFVYFVDLLGVRDFESIERRIRIAFEESFKESFRNKSVFINMINVIKQLRPTVSFDQSGTSLGINLVSNHQNKTLQSIFKEIDRISKKVPTLIIFDEFQDIATIHEAEALFRDSLQNISSSLPIIILGSKKHLLSNIFSNNDSPLFNFGEDLEIGPIAYTEYHKYIADRFEKYDLKISEENSKLIQDMLLRIPEPINMLCDFITEIFQSKEITADKIQHSLIELIKRRQSRFEEYITKFSKNEEKVLIQLAHDMPVATPSGKSFVAKINVSQGGISNIITKFENDAIIYKTDKGYELADPLLANYLKIYR